MSIHRNRNEIITYTVDKNINNNLYISVQNGEVIVQAPWYFSKNQIQEIVEEKKRWIQNYEEDEKKPGFYKIIRRKGEFMDNIQNETFYNKVIELFQNAKKNLSTAVNITMVYSYYEAGRMIVEEEQGGKERAAYGKYILKELSQRLTQKFGRGYSYDNLKLMRKFYLVYSKDSIG